MKYGFIGCGNMGSAIARALAKKTTDIMITDRSGKARDLALELGIAYSDIQQIAQTCDRIFLAVKPQMMEQALFPIQNILIGKKPVIITMAAGISMNTIVNMAGTPLPVIRIMPNTPAAVGMGMTVYCANELVAPEILTDFTADMEASGRLDPLPEHLIDAASAISGSGPAFTYMFMEALADGAVACGIPRASALEYAAVTIAGAAQMLMESGKHPGQLKDDVCSPAGSTIAGVRVLEERSFRSAVMDCVVAAYIRNKELGNS